MSSSTGTSRQVGRSSSHEQLEGRAALPPGHDGAGAAGRGREHGALWDAIRASRRSIAVGGYRIWGGGVRPTYADAVEAFGQPRDCRAQGSHELVVWPRLGLTMRFAGLADCPDGDAALDQLTLTGRHWHTLDGLRIGDSEGRLRQLYPRALPRRGERWLVQALGTRPLFAARLQGTRISAFDFRISPRAAARRRGASYAVRREANAAS